jgi:hypothetical protein
MNARIIQCFCIFSLWGLNILLNVPFLRHSQSISLQQSTRSGSHPYKSEYLFIVCNEYLHLDRRIIVWVPVGARDFCLFQSGQNSFEAHPTLRFGGCHPFFFPGRDADHSPLFIATYVPSWHTLGGFNLSVSVNFLVLWRSPEICPLRFETRQKFPLIRW